MNNSRFTLCFIAMLFMQLVLTKYCHIGSYISISLLPAMILCQPTHRPTWMTMLIAFCCGLFVDVLADGMPGLNAAALIPVAVFQKLLIRIFIGEEAVERHYGFSFWGNGVVKISAMAIIEIALFMTIYITLDCAGKRDAGFIALSVLESTLASYLFSLVVINTLCPRPER